MCHRIKHEVQNHALKIEVKIYLTQFGNSKNNNNKVIMFTHRRYKGGNLRLS